MFREPHLKEKWTIKKTIFTIITTSIK